MAALFLRAGILIRLSPHFRHHCRTHPLQSSNEKATTSSRSSKFNTLDTANIPTFSKTPQSPEFNPSGLCTQKKTLLRILAFSAHSTCRCSLSLSRTQWNCHYSIPLLALCKRFIAVCARHRPRGAAALGLNPTTRSHGDLRLKSILWFSCSPSNMYLVFNAIMNHKTNS